MSYQRRQRQALQVLVSMLQMKWYSTVVFITLHKTAQVELWELIQCKLQFILCTVSGNLGAHSVFLFWIQHILSTNVSLWATWQKWLTISVEILDLTVKVHKVLWCVQMCHSGSAHSPAGFYTAWPLLSLYVVPLVMYTWCAHSFIYTPKYVS